MTIPTILQNLTFQQTSLCKKHRLSEIIDFQRTSVCNKVYGSSEMNNFNEEVKTIKFPDYFLRGMTLTKWFTLKWIIIWKWRFHRWLSNIIHFNEQIDATEFVNRHKWPISTKEFTQEKSVYSLKTTISMKNFTQDSDFWRLQMLTNKCTQHSSQIVWN